jgi:hypothetical protein
MRIEKGCTKSSLTHCWQNSGDSSKQEPDDALRKERRSKFRTTASEDHLSYLVPQEPSRGLRCVSMKAKAEQANKHDDKQDDVSNTRDGHCRLASLDVDRLAGGARSCTSIAELSGGLA